MTYLLFTSGTFSAITFNSFKILADGTKIAAIEANGYDVLAILGIDATSELKKGTVIRTPIQFPFDIIQISAGGVQINTNDFATVPDFAAEFNAAAALEGATLEAPACLVSLIQSLSV